MDHDAQRSTDGPDTLIWRMAADALALATSTTRGLVNAMSVHPEAAPTAQKRVDTLREFADILMRASSEMQQQLDGTGQIGEFNRIIDGFWESADDADMDEAA